MKYFVSIAVRTVEVLIDGGTVVVDGKEVTAELRPVQGTPVQNLLVDQLSWIVPIEADGRGRWFLQRWGDRFEVTVVDERTRHIHSLVGAGAGPTGPAALKAPMPGLVVRLLVEPGQTVASGQGILVLEAMKMENELKAPGAGVVGEIQVKVGAAVEKGALMVTFQPLPGSA